MSDSTEVNEVIIMWEERQLRTFKGYKILYLIETVKVAIVCVLPGRLNNSPPVSILSAIFRANALAKIVCSLIARWVETNIRDQILPSVMQLYFFGNKLHQCNNHSLATRIKRQMGSAEFSRICKFYKSISTIPEPLLSHTVHSSPVSLYPLWL